MVRRYPSEDTAPPATHGNGGAVSQLEYDPAVGPSCCSDAIYRHDVRAMHAHELLRRERAFELIERGANEISPARGEDSRVHVVGCDEIHRRDRDDHLAIANTRHET